MSINTLITLPREQYYYGLGLSLTYIVDRDGPFGQSSTNIYK